MKEIIKINKDIELRSNISEVTSISLECLYDFIDNDIDGKFEVVGSYKDQLTEEEIDFNEQIPFTYSFLFDVDPSSIKIDILDFDYNINKKEINLEIEYEVNFEKQIINEEYEEISSEHNEREDDKTIEIEDIIDNKEKDINIINNDLNEKYITYKIHVCEMNETIESIAIKYNVSAEEIKSVNNVDEISYGYKIIIPLDE